MFKKKKAQVGSLADLGEFGFIGKIRRALKAQNPKVVLGIGDDAAVFKPTPGREMVFTTDMLVEGPHFDFQWITPRQLGAKAMAVNISDCAAMGAQPTLAVVSLGVPSDYPLASLEAFYDGMRQVGERFGAQIVGGDMVGSDRFVVNVALVGEVESGRSLRRSGAQAGDALFVTGTLGDSAAGLYALRHPSAKGREATELLKKRHLNPVPRCNVGRELSARGLATSAIDISDGLSSEIHHLCEESGVGAEISEEAVPFSPSLVRYCDGKGLDPMDFALNGGEDYELLFTAPWAKISEIPQKVSVKTGVAIKSIGRMVPQAKGITLMTRVGRRIPLKAKGFDHFIRAD